MFIIYSKRSVFFTDTLYVQFLTSRNDWQGALIRPDKHVTQVIYGSFNHIINPFRVDVMYTWYLDGRVAKPPWITLGSCQMLYWHLLDPKHFVLCENLVLEARKCLKEEKRPFKVKNLSFFEKNQAFFRE